MDFVTDSLFNGHRFRSLTIVDNYSRECLAIEVGQHIKGEDVVSDQNRPKVYGKIEATTSDFSTAYL
jgi:putative transposase